MNVTDDPEQTGLAEDATVMLTGNSGLTDTGYGMLDAGFPITQVLSEEVSVQVMMSPFVGA